MSTPLPFTLTGPCPARHCENFTTHLLFGGCYDRARTPLVARECQTCGYRWFEKHPHHEENQ